MRIESPRTGARQRNEEAYAALPAYGAARPEGSSYIMGGCGIAGVMNMAGEKVCGDRIARMLSTMSERENGLGAGYAAYGLFPDDLKDLYCLQFLFDDEKAMTVTEEYLKNRGAIVRDERVPTQRVDSLRPPRPIVWRYFFRPDPRSEKFRTKEQSEDECMVEAVMGINGAIPGAICISSGKDMAVFKGNGHSYEIAEHFDIARYDAAMWLSHSRFPTNSPGWWAGAHPISLLDWSVCHNGEITSYGVNRRFVEMNGYRCSLLTDTEVITYTWDLLVRRHGLPIPIAAVIMAPPYYRDIERLDENGKKLAYQLRATYKEAFLNGPFSILVGRSRPEITMVAMADRKKLRPLLIGESDDGKTVYAASEECAIRSVQERAETWEADPGSPMIARVGEGIVRRGIEPPFGVMDR